MSPTLQHDGRDGPSEVGQLNGYPFPCKAPLLVQSGGFFAAVLDGNNVNQSFIAIPGGPASLTGIAVDAAHVFWGNFTAFVDGGTIGRANLDSTGINPSFISGANNPKGVAVNALSPPATPATPLDTTPPNTRIGAEKINQAKRKSTFKFSSSEPDSSFFCKLDKKPFKSCTSPKTYKNLKPGKHKFKVKATDAAANVDPTPAVRSSRSSRSGCPSCSPMGTAWVREGCLSDPR